MDFDQIFRRLLLDALLQLINVGGQSNSRWQLQPIHISEHMNCYNSVLQIKLKFNQIAAESYAFLREKLVLKSFDCIFSTFGIILDISFITIENGPRFQYKIPHFVLIR